MPSELESSSSKKPNAFQKIFCTVCNRDSWHYNGVCGGHSKLEYIEHPDGTVDTRHHAIPSTVMLMRLRKEPEGLSEAELRRANKMNRDMIKIASDSHASVPVSWDDADLDYGYGAFAVYKPKVTDQEIKDPNKHYCTFCGNEVQSLDLTMERTKPRISFRNEVYRDPDTGELRGHRKIQVISETIKACPDCCLNIRRPITIQRT